MRSPLVPWFLVSYQFRFFSLFFSYKINKHSFIYHQPTTTTTKILTLALLPVLLATLDLTTASPSLRNKNKQKRDDTWGGALSLGPPTSHILSATTIFIPGTAPSTQAGDLFLWPGMSNGTGDLIQITIESWPDSSDGTYGNAWCGATAGQWCLETGLFGSFGQVSGDLTPAVDGDTNILINYTRNADGINWTQTASNAKTGAPLSQFVHESKPMTGWGTGTECDDNCTGTIEEQRYLNTTITLASADFDFKSTLGVSGGTTYTGLTISTDGTVLTIDEIVVPAMDP